MKNLLTFFFALISLQSFAFPWETVTGNGNLKKETRQASGYTAVTSQGSMNVNISYGNSNSITVEADENLLPYIETTVEKGALVIRTKKNINLKTKNKIVVNVSLTKLTALHLSGSGNISGDGAFSNTGKTDIGVAGSGNIKLAFGNFNELGNIDCSGVPCNDVFARVSGSGDVKVYANKTIDAQVSGSGGKIIKI